MREFVFSLYGSFPRFIWLVVFICGHPICHTQQSFLEHPAQFPVVRSSGSWYINSTANTRKICSCLSPLGTSTLLLDMHGCVRVYNPHKHQHRFLCISRTWRGMIYYVCPTNIQAAALVCEQQVCFTRSSQLCNTALYGAKSKSGVPSAAPLTAGVIVWHHIWIYKLNNTGFVGCQSLYI